MKLTEPMLRALVYVSKHGMVPPDHLHEGTRKALESRGLVERFVPDEMNNQPPLLRGVVVHPEMLRLSDAGRPYATLGRLGVKTTKRKRR